MNRSFKNICLIVLVAVCFLIFVYVYAFSQDTWARAYGGTDDDHVYSAQQTSDGGYILAGSTRSFGAGDYDFWILKLDPSGSILWQKTYGSTGSVTEQASSIQQTSDGGYIVVG